MLAARLRQEAKNALNKKHNKRLGKKLNKKLDKQLNNELRSLMSAREAPQHVNEIRRTELLELEFVLSHNSIRTKSVLTRTARLFL